MRLEKAVFKSGGRRVHAKFLVEFEPGQAIFGRKILELLVHPALQCFNLVAEFVCVTLLVNSARWHYLPSDHLRVAGLLAHAFLNLA